jgi:hypothetical protein
MSPSSIIRAGTWTQGQDLDRQESIIAAARDAGYYIVGVYREKASGARADRPELLRLIADLQPGEVVVAEKIDRISRLPLPEAEKLIETIRNKGARLAVPSVVDLSDTITGRSRRVSKAADRVGSGANPTQSFPKGLGTSGLSTSPFPRIARPQSSLRPQTPQGWKWVLGSESLVQAVAPRRRTGWRTGPPSSPGRR